MSLEWLELIFEVDFLKISQIIVGKEFWDRYVVEIGIVMIYVCVINTMANILTILLIFWVF